MKATLPRLFIALSVIVHAAFFVILPKETKAQVPTVQDCMGAIPVCQDVYVEENSYSGDGNYHHEIFNPSGDCTYDCPGSCLDGEQNSVWYIFTVQVGGLLRFTIDPVGSGDDYDWAVYDLTELRCSDIYTSYTLMQKSCNAYGNPPNGNTGISTPSGGSSNCNHCGGSGTSLWNKDLIVTAGRTYVLCVENWSGTTQGYTLDFSASTAAIFDNVRPEIDTVLSGQITCGSTEIVVDFSENVSCESVDPTDFIVAGPGGPYTVIDAQGEACLVGGTWEKRYTLILDKPIREDGDYSVQIIPLSFISDACNNFALGNTIMFHVSLGAPIINEFNIDITSATCGLSNGSITGLQIIGTPPYTLAWTDESGNVVGNAIDLVNVPTGNYYLKITDPHTCQTIGGPYFVDQTGAPAIDETNLVIVGANWGANNGSISGLQINGNEPFTYVWTDASNNPVGTDPDLINVYAGNYFLLVTDNYGCDTLAGPYFVQQIGGPLGVQAVAQPMTICAGESSQLTATAFGGTGTYSFNWSSVPAGFSSDIQNPIVYPTVTTAYTVSISDGYNITASEVTIVVNPVPVSNAGSDQTIPYGTSTTIYGTGSGGISYYYYSWEPASLLINPTAQNPATKNLYQTTLFRLRVTDTSSGCESDFDTVVVSLNGGPLGVTVSLQHDSICKGQATTITAYGFGGDIGNYTYTWYYGTNLLKTESGSVSTLDVAPSTNGNFLYTVKINDGYNEFTSDISLHVSPTPAFAISGGPQIIACPADTVLLQPTNTFMGASYYWSNGSTEPFLHVATTGIGYNARMFKLTVTNEFGCQYADSVMVIFDFAACFGIQEYSTFPDVSVYPNPTTGQFNVDLENGDGFDRIQVVSPQGAIVLNKELGKLPSGKCTISLDLSGYPKGVYLLRAIHERFIAHKKIVVQ
jgi:hypothetical protein